MYKFSRCHIIVFMIFRSIYRFSTKIARFLTKFGRKSPRQFSKKNCRFSVFSVFTVPLSCLRCISTEFSRILSMFSDFFKNRWDRWGPNFWTLHWVGSGKMIWNLLEVFMQIDILVAETIQIEKVSYNNNNYSTELWRSRLEIIYERIKVVRKVCEPASHFE
jgi:hypothetical protein